MTGGKSADGNSDAMSSTPSALKPIIEAIAQQSLPPVDTWSPQRTVRIPMRIGRDGRWYYEGTTIDRPALVRLFASVLRRDPDGHIYLVTPGEKYEIDIDDAPFVAKELTVSGEGAQQVLALQTNVGDYVIASNEHPIFMDESGPSVGASPYLHVRGGLNALISRPVYYQLVDLAAPSPDDPDMAGVFSKGAFFALGSLKE